MSEGLTFSASRWTALFGSDERYDVEEVRFAVEATRRVRFYSWHVGADCKHSLVGDYATRSDAIESCHKHHAQRTSGAVMAPAGPVSVDADGEPV